MSKIIALQFTSPQPGIPATRSPKLMKNNNGAIASVHHPQPKWHNHTLDGSRIGNS
ncbi:hypothetical protein [Coleofasciculus sp.]|uniref:hypothetical protein n=1 Tax=Coleofasciculus sp. TaxID=3100458 RepID=UPI003A1D10D1